MEKGCIRGERGCELVVALSFAGEVERSLSLTILLGICSTVCFCHVREGKLLAYSASVSSHLQHYFLLSLDPVLSKSCSQHRYGYQWEGILFCFFLLTNQGTEERENIFSTGKEQTHRRTQTDRETERGYSLKSKSTCSAFPIPGQKILT